MSTSARSRKQCVTRSTSASGRKQCVTRSTSAKSPVLRIRPLLANVGSDPEVL